MSSGVSRERIRLLYLIPDLRGGGAELALIHFLEHHDPDAFELHLAVCRPTGVHMARLPARVTLHTLGKTGRWGVPALCWRLRGLVRRLRPDALISYLWYADGLQLLTRRFFGRRGSWPRSICSIRNVSAELDEQRFGSFKRLALRRLYPDADACLGISAGVVEDFERSFARGARPLTWLQHNPFPLEAIRTGAEAGVAEWSDDSPRLLAVGRLTRQKGFDVLLTALARLREMAWQLQVLGEGEERGALERQVERLGLAPRVSFRGFVDNPYPTMRSAALLLVPSRFEGFGGVLVEALALGTPIIAADCPSGPAEVLGDGAYGHLVPSEDAGALATAIEHLLKRPEALARYRARSAEGAERFAAERIMPGYEARIRALTEGRPA